MCLCSNGLSSCGSSLMPTMYESFGAFGHEPSSTILQPTLENNISSLVHSADTPTAIFCCYCNI